MKARVRLFLHYLESDYCYTAAWRKADRQRAFRRRRKH